MSVSLPRSAPENLGVGSESILEFLKAVESARLEFHSLMVLKHGQVIAEGWWKPYAHDLKHMLFSLSKSFVSSAIGFLVDSGQINLEDAVISFFPDDLPLQISDNLRAMKIKDLLCMASGHKEDPTNSEAIRASKNWIKTILEFEVEFVPGTHFVYNSGASFLLSAIVQKVTGKNLLEFLTPRLLEPLGIEGATWASNVQGINFGGWGLNLTSEDIAKFGLLYLQKGVWNGQQILSETWIDQATSSQISNGDKPTSDWQQGYGYQFWRCQHGTYRGDGAFGQYCVVMPDQDAVVVITSAVDDMQQVLNLVWETLLPALTPSQTLAPSNAIEMLELKLSSLELPVVQGEKITPFAARVSGLKFVFEDNDPKILSMGFQFLAEHLELTVTNNSGNHNLVCAFERWQNQETSFEPSAGFGNLELRKASLQGAWIEPEQFEMQICFHESAFTYNLRFDFSKDSLVLHSRINVGFGETVFKPMYAKVQPN
jgi:CubicO group peptidase (beta-lactamase class C family)